jgi:hypothetical protein
MQRGSPDKAGMSQGKEKRPQDWRAQEQLLALQETHGLSGEALQGARDTEGNKVCVACHAADKCCSRPDVRGRTHRPPWLVSLGSISSRQARSPGFPPLDFCKSMARPFLNLPKESFND